MLNAVEFKQCLHSHGTSDKLTCYRADEGGEKPYRLFADALASSKRTVTTQLVTRGKEQLILIRPYENGLIMHSLYYPKNLS